MAKLVILSEGMSGRSHELTVERTTIGRVEGNTLQIPEPSVSSHHCEVLLRGTDIVVHDLNSTNGTYINGEKITESVLKPGQTLRLGQIELRLEGVESAAASAQATAPAAAAVPAPALKRPADSTLVLPRGVSLNELEQGGRAGGFDGTSKGFAKKSDKVNLIFIIAGVVIAIIIGVMLIIAYHSSGKAPLGQ